MIRIPNDDRFSKVEGIQQDWPDATATIDDYELDTDGLPVHVKVSDPVDPEAREFAATYPVQRPPRDDGARLPQQPRLTRAQQRLEDILTDTENELRLARDLVVDALEDLSLILQPQHPNLPTLIGQQLEQVIEHRTLRRR